MIRELFFCHLTIISTTITTTKTTTTTTITATTIEITKKINNLLFMFKMIKERRLIKKELIIFPNRLMQDRVKIRRKDNNKCIKV